MKKNFVLFLLILVVVIVFSGCNNSVSKSKVTSVSVQGETFFAQELCSYNTLGNTLDYLFFCNEKDKENWTLSNIDDAYISINNKNINVNIIDIELNDNVQSMYYMGLLLFDIKASAISGDAILAVKFKNSHDYKNYDIGQLSFAKYEDNSSKYISSFKFNGIVATDENENVNTYGVVLELGVKENIIIKAVDFGLDTVGVDSNYIVFSEKEFKEKRIRNKISEGTLEKVIPDAYQKRTLGEEKEEIELKLGKGTHYIYLPLKYTGDLSLSQSFINIKYETLSDGIKEEVSNSFPFYSEFSKSEKYVNQLFEKE